MAEKLPKHRKRKHFEIDKSRQSPFQNSTSRPASATVVSKAPRGINAAEFAESRALEIQNMMLAMANASSGNKRVFQSVPRHMRRRAASHNSKRMPVRLREAYNREAAKTKEKMKEPKKKQSRQHRRRPSNLLEEYNRRQRKHVWLETHIWHAKRFKMEECWGYKIPLHPNDKSIKASYRAMATGCLMQDVSYYQCIEVSGEQESIITAMKHLTNSEAGLTMAAKQYLNGSREGHVVLYKYDKYPWNAIGPVMFLWQQHLCHGAVNQNTQAHEEIVNDSMVTKLWVWSHPACRDEVLSEIIHACSLEGHTELIDEKVELDEKNETESKKPKVLPKSNPCNEPPKFLVTVLREQLVRFRLTGPKSHALLASTLDVCEWKNSVGSRWWQSYGSSEDHRRKLNEQSAVWDQMKGVASPGVLVSGAVVALVVKDPRLGLPLRKSSVDMASEELYQETGEELTFPSCTAGSAFSPIWDLSVREEVKKTKLPEKELNELRSKMVVPGSKLDPGDDTSRIPILVIQQPGTRGDTKNCAINFGCGYDVVIPAGWSMAFWIALVYRGARVGGSRELATCSREQALPHFPCDFPDTEAGREYNAEQTRTAGDKYTRYPPAKRPNYEKLGVGSPFGGDWERLLDEWGKEVNRLEMDLEKFICSGNREEAKFSSVNGELRKPNQVEHIQTRVGETVATTEQTSRIASSVVTTDQASLMPSSSARVDETVVTSDQASPMPSTSSSVGETVATTDQTSPMASSSTMVNETVVTSDQASPMPSCSTRVGGTIVTPDQTSSTPSSSTMVNETVVTTDPASPMPSSTSCTHFNVIRTYSTRRRLQQVIQSLQKTSSAKTKKFSKDITFKEHFEFLRKNIAPYTRSLVCLDLLVLFKGCPLVNAVIFIPTLEDLRSLEKDKNYGGPVEHMHRCRIDESSTASTSRTLVGGCSRKAIGYISSGQYSFARGQGAALGFCTFLGFCELVFTASSNCRPLVLVRNTTSFQYRFASFNVV